MRFEFRGPDAIEAEAAARAFAFGETDQASPAFLDRVLVAAVAGRRLDGAYAGNGALAVFLSAPQNAGERTSDAPDLSRDMLAAFTPPLFPFTGGVATATAHPPDIVSVVAPSAAAAATAAQAIGAAIAPPGSVPPGDADAIWEALSRGARLAQQFRASRRIAAAAMTWKGRGRTVGPVNGDLLVRYGVSAWR